MKCPFISGNTPYLEVYLFDINVTAQAFPVFGMFSIHTEGAKKNVYIF